MPKSHKNISINYFLHFFDGLLPEGVMLHGILCITKIANNGYSSQLIVKGNNLVGEVTVKFSENELMTERNNLKKIVPNIKVVKN